MAGIPSNWHQELPRDVALERLEREGGVLEAAPLLSEAEAVGLGWSLLVADREEQVWALARDVPGFRWSAVGLLDPDVDVWLESNDPRFGVILYAEDEQLDPAGRREDLEFEEIRLPVVVRHGTYEEHQPPAMPHGRLACWATSRAGARSGWLTARHVADHPEMSNWGFVVDRAPECLDAALVNVAARGSGLPRRLATPLVGARVEVDFPSPIVTVVREVATNLGVQHSSRFPLRFKLDAAGVPGDSGSLIRNLTAGDPMGIYLGAFTSSQTSQRSGICLALTQLAYHMNLEVYT